MASAVIAFLGETRPHRRRVVRKLPDGVHDLRGRFLAHKEPLPAMGRSPMLAVMTALLQTLTPEQFAQVKNTCYHAGLDGGDDNFISAWSYLAKFKLSEAH